MPGIIIHTEIARRVALALGRSDLLVEGSAVSAIYFQGAIAPDIGVFPGCFSLLSELSHYISSGELVQRLRTAADSPEREAFALGWLTHYLGDTLIHPLINREAGRIRHPGEDRSLSWEDDPALHLQVELGLDGAMFFELSMKLFKVPAEVLDEEWCRYLALTYSELYRAEFETAPFLRSHRRAQHYNRLLMHLGLIHAARSRGRKIAPELWWSYVSAFLPAKVLELILGDRSPYKKVSSVYNPGAEFIAGISAAISLVVQRSTELFSEPSAKPANLNLDTGEPAVPGSYRSLDMAAEKLEQLKASAPVSAAID